MTGRYLIYTPLESSPLDSRRRHCRRDERQFEACWHRFLAVCRSLHRDRLTYSVQFNLTGDRPHVLIMATGTAKPRKRPVARGLTLPPPVPAQTCRDRALEVEWFLPENLGRRNSGTTYWRNRQPRYQELSGMTEDGLRIEHEYWRELERLSREHSGAGRDNATAEDETAGVEDVAVEEVAA